MASLATRCRLGLADSEFNRAEIAANGYRPTAVAPILLDLEAFDREIDEARVRPSCSGEADGGADWLFVGPSHSEQVPARRRQGVRGLPRAPRPERPAAHRRRRRLRAVRGGAAGVRAQARAQRLRDPDGPRLARQRSRPTTERRTCTCASPSTRASACRSSSRMHFGVPIVAFGVTAVPETFADAGICLARQVSCARRRSGRSCADRRGASARSSLAAGARRLQDFTLERSSCPLPRGDGSGAVVKLAFVTPRYGADVIGGAEIGARMLAEQLAALDGWSVEILTTCARDAWTWANDYAPGTHRREWRDGAPVSPIAKERDADFRRLTLLAARAIRSRSATRTARLDRSARTREPRPDRGDPRERPRSRRVHALPVPPDRGRSACDPRAGRAPSRGARRARHPPALFDDVFEAARGLAFYTEGERAITEELFPVVVAKPQVVVGLGIDPPPAASGPHGIAGLGSRPYLLVLGRVDHSKGTHLLASFFARYKQRRPGPLALAVVGPVQRPVPSHPDVVQVGEVDEATKWALLRGATALVSPSAFESFSLVLFESWEAGRPVLVNARCSATLEHVTRSGGGLAFDTYAVFEAALDRLLLDDALQQSLAVAGARYAEQYRWPVVIDRYRRFAERLASTLPADA